MTPDADDFIRLVPGDGVAIIGPPTIVLVDAADNDVIDRLWDCVSEGGGADDVLEELSSIGLRGLGAFAVAQLEGRDVRIFVRGSARAAFSDAETENEVDGSSVRTWLEHLVIGCRRIELDLGGGASTGQSPYRLSRGVVPVSAVAWELDRAPRGAGAVAAKEGPAGETVDSEPPAALAGSPASGSDVAMGSAASRDADRPLGDRTDAGHTLHPGLFDRAMDSAAQSEAEFSGASASAMPSPVTPPVSLPVESIEQESDAEPEPYDYDALYGRTTHKSVQDAAVEVEPEETDSVAPGGAGPDVADQLPDAVEADRADTRTSEEPAPPDPPPLGGLISGVPGAGAGTESEVTASELGDHDGMTMSVAQLRAMRGESSVTSAADPSRPVTGGPTVQALVCRDGHPSPPVLDSCRLCGTGLAGPPVVIARPPMGRILLSNGLTVELDRSAIIGRNPRVEGALGGEVPSTVKIDGSQALSRSHAMVRLEGWQVMVEDLGSANGTTVTLPGREPRRLREGEPVLIEHGTHLDLGGEITGTYDALS